jgi:two-component system LytT family response regulator
MIKTVLVDDEPNNLETLHQLLVKYCPQVVIAGTADSVTKAREVIVEQNPDLVFLDIEMPYGNAFELLNSLPAIDFEIIFVTAFGNYAIEAIKFSALDYLLKPLNIKELQAAVLKAA